MCDYLLSGYRKISKQAINKTQREKKTNQGVSQHRDIFEINFSKLFLKATEKLGKNLLCVSYIALFP